MLCRFYLQIGSNIVSLSSQNCHEVTEEVANSSQLEQSWVRKDFGGVSRKFGSRIEFVGAAAEYLVAQWGTSYVNSKASFAIHVADNHWNFSEVWQCPLDFSTFTYDGNKVGISCVDNSAASLIKANGGTKGSYQVAQLKSSTPLLYDRVQTKNEAEYMMLGNTIEGDDTWTKATCGFVAAVWIVPISIVDSTRIVDHSQFVLQNQGGHFGLPEEASDDHFAEVYNLTNFFIDFTNLRIRARSSAYGAGTILRYQLVQWSQSYDSLREASEDQSAMTLYEGEATMNTDRTFNCPLTGNFSVEQGNNLSFVVSIKDSLFTMSTWWMNTNHGSLSWMTKGENVDMDVIEPVTLLNKVLESVADGKMTLTGEISSTVGGVTNARLAGMKMMAAESVRGFDDAYIHTSFNQFAKMMETVFGYVYEVTESGSSAVVSFKHRRDMFGNTVKSLQSVNDFEKGVDSSMLYSEVKIGYEVQEYDNGNAGNDEWNFENDYMTGVAMKSSTLDLMCPYRADCYGIEELVAKRSEQEKTDKDDDVFIVKCLASAQSGRWRIDRTIAVTGAYTTTVFNAAFSPIYMVEANKGFLSSFCNGLKLSMTGGSRDITVGGEAVTKDFTFAAADRLFKCCSLKITTNDQELPIDKSGKISFEYGGELHNGYLKSVKTKYQSEDPVQYELIEC